MASPPPIFHEHEAGIPPVGHAVSDIYAYERGDLENKFIPISEEEAGRIVERIRRVVSGGHQFGRDETQA